MVLAWSVGFLRIGQSECREIRVVAGIEGR